MAPFDELMPEDSFQTVPPERRPSRAPWAMVAVALLAGAGAAGFLLFELQRARADGAAALQDARARLDEAQRARAELEARLAAAETEKKDLATAKDSLSHDVQARDEELAKLRGEFDELQDKMKAEIEKGNVRLSQDKGRIKVDVVDEILFDVGDSLVSKQGEEVLSRVGAVLAKMKDKQIQVSGHTDDLPISTRLKDRFATNWELSSARAITVVRFLEERAGVPGRRLVAAAHSQYDPIAANRTASGRQRNRRIEILLTPEIDPERDAKIAAAAQPRPAPAAAKTTAPKAVPAAHTKPPAKRAPKRGTVHAAR